MESAADWPPPITRVPHKPKVAQFCAAPWPNFTPPLTDDGKAFRTLNIIDEYSRECLAIRVDRKLNSGNVIDVLSDLFILRGIPSFMSDVSADGTF